MGSPSHDDTVRLWDMNGMSPTLLAILAAHAGRVRSIAFAADGSGLASGVSNGGVSLWDLNSTPPNSLDLKRVSQLPVAVIRVFLGRHAPGR